MTDDAVGSPLDVRFDDDVQAQLRDALSQVCREAPDARVTTARYLTAVPSGGEGEPVAVVVPVAVTVAVGTRDVVALDIDPDSALGGTGVVGPQAVDRGPVARATLEWRFSCEAVPEPPALALRVVDGVAPSPVRVELDQRAAARAVLAACTDMTVDLLVEWGWDIAGLRAP